MKRYDIVDIGKYECYNTITEQSDGDYILFTDHEADKEAAIKELKEKVAYVESMGLRFGIMKTSNHPEGFLAHTWDEDSDHERMFREWSESIGWEAAIKKAVEDERERTDVYRTFATVEFYVHKWGKEGRLPVIDGLPEGLIGQDVEVIIRSRNQP